VCVVGGGEFEIGFDYLQFDSHVWVSSAQGRREGGREGGREGDVPNFSLSTSRIMPVWGENVTTAM